MQNRRKFLLQTTLAAGSFVFLKPLKAAALSPANTSLSAEKLTILHLNTLQKLSQKTSLLPLPNKLPALFKNRNSNTLLLSTGNSMGSKSASKVQHIEKLTRLKRAGCDAIVPNCKDLENGFPYFTELTDECKLTSLAGDNHQTTDGNILPYHVTMKGNIKVGIIGNGLLNQGKFINNEVEEIAFRLNKTAEFLKTNHDCNLIVSMNPYNSHSNTCHKTEEKELAALTKNIDVIVSSNSTQKHAVTYIVKNALRHEIVLNYEGTDSPYLKGIDISLNSKMEKTNFALRRFV